MTIGGDKLAIALVINQFTLREKCPYSELFRSAFSPLHSKFQLIQHFVYPQTLESYRYSFYKANSH